ncbi:patatin-like phospholipase, putative [Plasmodium relictum]|uniref:Patatin-like phospholipase, putative n=1 Tax=Plasmodium relictum TaxID=85471 RepID=A0A1J1H3H3_PLARL|nr:patatin-like phospholipase, putative [Plasmodium relictum]CRG99451.1 patatin-like phospholipase, putative [Plasmodium relictum]
MKTPEFSLDSLKKKNRKKKKKNLNFEKFSAHYFLKLPIFIILMIAFSLNAFIYLFIRCFIYFFENISFFVVTKYKDFCRYVKKKDHLKENKDEIFYEKNESILKIESLMGTCNNYYDYIKYAYRMDVLTGKIVHINENDDYINIYDVNLLKKTSESIKNNLLNNDILLLLEDIKIATSPRIKAVFQEKYYCKTYSTPHIIVTNFINNILNGLNYIENYVKEQKEKNYNYLYSDEYLLIKKYFKEIFRQWGNTALFLSGGAILGLHHFGVLETFLKASINIDYFNDFIKTSMKKENISKKKKKNISLKRKNNSNKNKNIDVKSDLKMGNLFLKEKKRKNKKEKNYNLTFNRNNPSSTYKKLKFFHNDELNLGESNNTENTQQNECKIKSNIIKNSFNEINEIKNGNSSEKKIKEDTFIKNNKKDNFLSNRENDFVKNFEDNIMPQIICGTSAGSIIAAWICSRTNKELLEEFNIEFIYNIVSCFSSENWFYSFFNIYKKGNFYDIDKIIKIIYNLYGDMTFLEAFIKTNLVLNITVTRAECENNTFSCDEDGHIVLNYMNSPNVLIYTAVLASCSFPYLLQPFKLLEKKYNKENVYRFMSINQISNSKLILNSSSNNTCDNEIPLKEDDEFPNIKTGSINIKYEKKENNLNKVDSANIRNSSYDNYFIPNDTQNSCTVIYEKKDSCCGDVDTYIKEKNNFSKNVSMKNNIRNKFNKSNEDYVYKNKEDKLKGRIDKLNSQSADQIKNINNSNNYMKNEITNTKNVKKVKNTSDSSDLFTNDSKNSMIMKDKKEEYNKISMNEFSRKKILGIENCEDAYEKKGDINLEENKRELKNHFSNENIIKKKNYEKKKRHNEFIDFNEYKNIDLLNEEYTIINSVQFKNMYFHDGSLKSDIPARNLNQILSVNYRIVSQVNPHVFPFTGVRIHGEAGKPVKWRGNYGNWRAGFLMSCMEILFKENMRYILRLMALLDLSPTIRGLNAGSIAMQNYNGDITLHPKRLYLKHFKLISVSNYDDVEWYIQQGRQMTFQKLPLILNRMKIEKKLLKMKKCFF